jgi:beta-galactosidase
MNIFQNHKVIFVFRVCLICIVSYCFSNQAMGQNSNRERMSFNKDWRFQKNDPTEIVEKDANGKVIKSQLDYALVKDWYCSTGAEFVLPGDSIQATKRPAGNLGSNVTFAQTGFNDQDWRKLNLPHDWGIEGAFSYDLPGGTGKLPWAGTGWYRKHFNVAASDKGCQFSIEIDGAMAYPLVWLNGQFVGGWPYGYNSFRLDLTPYIKAGGDNVIAIRLTNPENSSRWYPGSGIYRNVWLVKTAPIHIGHWGTYITTPDVTAESATVDLKVTLENKSGSSADLKISTKIYELTAPGTKAANAVSGFNVSSAKIVAGGHQIIAALATIKNPKLWSTEKPNRYVAVTSIEEGGKVIDSYETPFGVRSIKFDADKGFLLNGKRVNLNGVCNHHDLGALGSAFNTRAAERQLQILKEMGFNALRTSHNMPAPELLDLCDQMGILVMDESFDCWKKGKTKNDYGLLFDDWHARDLRAEVHRDRNHPSIIEWSIGNEVRELNSPEGPAMAAHLTAIVNGEDPTRPTVVGSNSTRAPFNGIQNGVGVYGQNYNIAIYPQIHAANPTKPIVASETSSCVSSRGEYVFPVSNNKADGRGPFQVSSYDLYAPGWAISPDPQFKALEENPFVAGEYVWTGMDYLGEPTPFNSDVTNLLNFSDPNDRAKMEAELKSIGKIKSPSRSSYFGIVDLAGFKKDRFYLYQAHWLPELPMAHLLPHWNWAERIGLNTPVHVYTSGDEAELFLNGKSLGRKKKGAFEYRIRWDSVLYQPGVLKVIAYKNGKKWAEDVQKTTGAASYLKLSADRKVIKDDGLDLSFITVAVTDKDGLMVPRSNNLIKFEISGPGEIVGVDNGDATNFESFLAKEHKAFNGLALVIVRSKPGEAGAIKLKAISEGLSASTIQITTGGK